MPDQGLPSVRALYDGRVVKGSIEKDPAQRQLADRYDQLIADLSARESLVGAKASALGWLFKPKALPAKPNGIYVHGLVGRGKTMLMDWFYEIAPVKSKRRAHFHAFMQDVHERIHAHRQAFKRGETREEDPVPPVAKALAKDCQLLCFDEFHVLDIADAMILSRLFTVMFAEGVVLVATSNVVPDDLYRDGLNRMLFLPFIDLLKTNCDVWDLDARTDFRREKLMSFAAYQIPLGQKADEAMDEAFALATAHQVVAPLTLKVRGHDFHVPKASDAVARFTFDDLCAKPLGAADYIELAKRYGTIFIDHVPTLDFSKRNEAKRFIILIDVLYDNGNRLFVSAANAPDDIYQVPAGLKVGEFSRTSSRLFEMTGAKWLAKWSAKPT
ncbi:MAG: cell division protein ZapE [Rhizobiaceae bacterium]